MKRFMNDEDFDNIPFIQRCGGVQKFQDKLEELINFAKTFTTEDDQTLEETTQILANAFGQLLLSHGDTLPIEESQKQSIFFIQFINMIAQNVIEILIHNHQNRSAAN